MHTNAQGVIFDCILLGKSKKHRLVITELHESTAHLSQTLACFCGKNRRLFCHVRGRGKKSYSSSLINSVPHPSTHPSLKFSASRTAVVVVCTTSGGRDSCKTPLTWLEFASPQHLPGHLVIFVCFLRFRKKVDACMHSSAPKFVLLVNAPSFSVWSL